MNIEALAAEIASDPEDLGYAGKTDVEVAVLLNAPRSVLVPRESRHLLKWLAGDGRYEKIETGAANPAQTSVIRSICKAALRMVERDETVLDLSNPEYMGMIDALVAAGVISADDKASLVTMATTQQSRAAELGIGPVKPGNVGEARA